MSHRPDFRLPSAGGFALEPARFAEQAQSLAREPISTPGSDLVQQATAILSQEQLLRLATPELESMLGGQRSGDARVDPERWRRYAQDLADSLLGAIEHAAPSERASSDPASSVPLLRAPAAVPAGSESAVVIRLASEEAEPACVTFYATDLSSDRGYSIGASRVRFEPRILEIAAKGQASVRALVQIPEQTPRGSYCGLVQASGLYYVKAVIWVDVL